MRILFFLFSMLVASLLLLPAAIDIRCGLPEDVRDEEFPKAAELPETEHPDAESPEVSTGESPAPEETSAGDGAGADTEASFDAQMMRVILGGQEKELSLHDYLVGVLLGELPASFDAETKKAQAVAARTYLLYRAEHGFVLTGDGSVCTAYLSPDEAETRLGSVWSYAAACAEEAVSATDGEVLLYHGEYACALYHAMSWDKTEDVSQVFGGDLPYLVSVPTAEAHDLSGMVRTYEFEEGELRRLLSLDTVFPVTVKYDCAGRASCVTFGSTALSGCTVRTLLSLRSTAFTAERTEDGRLILTVHGYGHGVGMSQQGAQAMALTGADYKEILAHYYPGTVIARQDR